MLFCWRNEEEESHDHALLVDKLLEMEFRDRELARLVRSRSQLELQQQTQENHSNDERPSILGIVSAKTVVKSLRKEISLELEYCTRSVSHTLHFCSDTVSRMRHLPSVEKEATASSDSASSTSATKDQEGDDDYGRSLGYTESHRGDRVDILFAQEVEAERRKARHQREHSNEIQTAKTAKKESAAVEQHFPVILSVAILAFLWISLRSEMASNYVCS